LTDDPVIRRILVALDSAQHSLAMMESVASLAAALQAALEALYVEDENLLRLAALPAARELCVSSGRVEALDVARLQREMRALAREAEQNLVRTAARFSVTPHFRVVRGRVAQELLSAALQTDLVTLGRSGGRRGHGGLGSTARALAAQSPRPLLLLHGGPLRPPVCLLHEGTAAAPVAAAVAAQLARALGGGLTLIRTDGEPEEAVLKTLSGFSVPVHNLQVPAPLSTRGRREWLHRVNAGVLVVEAAGTMAVAEIEESRTPLVLVGGGRH